LFEIVSNIEVPGGITFVLPGNLYLSPAQHLALVNGSLQINGSLTLSSSNQFILDNSHSQISGNLHIINPSNVIDISVSDNSSAAVLDVKGCIDVRGYQAVISV
jgi:hypothetical protein